ncbi:MAG: protein kinase domain-containing protein [Planctomycetota bacterium]|jgi:tetratricopeptide (TPR) repeat protein/tRNA A-37 threonylcarbamoyl transferase component Bud32
MSKTEERDDKGPDKEESIPTASMGGSAVAPGGQIGPYKLLSILGEGGFGVVYLAERQRPVKRRVALKVIKPGMDTKQVIARFEAERQALALLEHPNIAHVFNAGTTDAGRPYFVMEYVKGIPITEHCDRHKLTIEERLNLFLRVCEAVQYAHQKGIIHRDIKPSNVQVCIENKKAGTPEYMSPEQAEMTGQDVDTRSDIYSLGVVLYELLTGVLPFEAKILREGGVEHIRQVILEEDPKTPSTRLSTLGGEESTMLAQRRRIDLSTLRRRLRGDLDWITLKAMEKDRTRRYQTAHALDEDIQRHLAHEPVLAGPPSKIYRLKKFLRKYRTQAIAAATAVVLLACIAVIFVMYAQAVNRGKEAESFKHRDILSKAMELRSNGQFQEALAKVETIGDSEHVGPKAQLLRARLVLELQGPAAAVTELQRLLNERDEIACQAHFLLARIYLESDPGDPETSQEYQQKAKEHQQKGEGLFSESAEAYFNRSMMAGAVNKTLEWLNKAIDFEPGHYDSREARALAYYALRKYNEMEIDASVMIGNESNNSQGYALRAIARRQKAIRQSEKELFGEAIKDHDKAIKLSPDESKLYDQRRRTHIQMGNYEQALSDARKCVELEPEDGIYRLHVFCALVASGYYDEAKVKYDDTIIEFGLRIKWYFDQTVAKYVSDTLDAGLSWHPPRRRPEGAAFLAMHESAEIYEQLAKKARRVVAEGFHATWSPDGTEFAYSCGIHGFSGIEIINLESGKTRLLTVPGFDGAWSPDGNHIAYVRSRQPLLLADVTTEYGAKTAPHSRREVWIIKADGTEEPRFLAKGHFPCWSRDSKRVFYHLPKDMKLYSISIEDGAKPTEIVSCSGNYPVVSPDEKYVAYMWNDELRIVELATKSVVVSWTSPLISVGGAGLNWSPNGRELSCKSQGNSGLWIYELDTKTASKVLSGPIGWSSWSPDMSRFAFQRMYGPLHRDIWVADLDPNISTTESLGPGRTAEQHCQEMISLFMRRIETDPEDKENYLSLAELMENLALLSADQYRMGEHEEALRTLTRIDKLRRTVLNSKSYPRDATFIAMALHQLDRDKEAEAALGRLRSLFEDGRHYRKLSYLCEAEQLFAGEKSKVYFVWECIESEKLNEAWQLLEKLRSLPRQEYTEIASSIESAIKGLAIAYYNRGKGAEHRGGDYGEAISDYEAAVRINPGYAPAFGDLAWLQAACPAAEFRDGAKAIENAN